MNEIVTRVEEIEKDRNILSTAVAELQRVTSEFIRLQTQKIKELEAKVESLTRTLDLWQELTGIEIVASPVVVHGQCAKCDHVGPLQNGICEGCFYEEIGV